MCEGEAVQAMSWWDALLDMMWQVWSAFFEFLFAAIDNVRYNVEVVVATLQKVGQSLVEALLEYLLA